MVNTRKLVVSALLRVFEEKAYSTLTLDSCISKTDMDSREVAFVSALFYGVIEKRITLDYIISLHSKIPIKKMSPEVREILRTAVYQVYYMDKVPESAVVNEAVKLVKIFKKQSASGFVNAVLRAILRNRDIVYPKEREEELSIRFSFPQWLIARWINCYGHELSEQILQALDSVAPVTARINTVRYERDSAIELMREENIEVTPHEKIKNCVYLRKHGAVNRLDSYNNGLFHIQDVSSQICCEVADPKEGEVIFDVCASPGGKSFTIAELMKDNGIVYSFDKTENRVSLVQKGAQRLGLSSVKASVRDALSPDKHCEKADLVLCDVPCSGFGIIRRKPEIKYKEMSEIDQLPELQYRILCNSAEMLKSGGRLIYSTCTLNPDENNRIIDRFLETHSEFDRYDFVPPYGYSRVFCDRDNELTLLPEKNGNDGFFIAKLIKR